MKDSKKIKESSFRWKRYFWVLPVVWTMIIIASLLWNIIHLRQMTLEIARIEVETALEKDTIYRNWVRSQNVVYVQVTEENPPNPYLSHIPERDITTPTGKQLTLTHPESMTRQIYKLTKGKYGTHVRTTSLNPIHPQNAPDPWEAKALKGLEREEREIRSIEKKEGKDYMRLIHPLKTEKECLKCHSRKGYKEGDIQGGISVAIPMEPLWIVERSQKGMHAMVHSLLWLLGMGGIGFLLQRIRESVEVQKQATEALKASEKKYRDIADNALVGVYKTNFKGDILYINEAVLKILEFETSEELTAVGALVRYKNPKDREVLIENLKKTGRVINFETVWVTKTGKLKNILLNATLDGDTLSGMIMDITERKAAEDALVTSKAYTESIIQNFLDTLVVIDAEAKIQTVNPATCRLLGYTEEELKGQPVSMIFAEEEEEEVKRVFQFFREPERAETLRPQDTIRNRELTYKTKDGRLIPMLFNASMLTDEMGNVTGVVAGAKDITEIKHAQETLRKTEERFRDVIENIFKFVPEGLLVLTDKLNVFRRNKALEDLLHQYAEKLDYTEEELAGIIIEQVKMRVVSGEKSDIRIPRKRK